MTWRKMYKLAYLQIDKNVDMNLEFKQQNTFYDILNLWQDFMRRILAK